MNERSLQKKVWNTAAAQRSLARTSEAEKNAVLNLAARILLERCEEIISANREDMMHAENEGVSKPLVKRLLFNRNKLETAAEGIRQVIALPDPSNRILEARELDQGLILKRVTCPIGVIGMIFESRPDALIQIASLCLKSGNGILLKGGSEAARTNAVLADVFRQASVQAGNPLIPPEWICLIETREQVSEMLKLDGDIDLIIPRGSNDLVRYIKNGTSIPVLGHADGICHSYIHEDADIAMAVRTTVDAKSQYAAVCNALETLLVHRAIAPKLLPPLSEALAAASVEIRGDEYVRSIIDCIPAEEQDWSTEYLDLILSIKVVNSLEEATAHIARYGSGHTDAVITSSLEAAELFMQVVDSADVFWNCSTRFSDGYRYGLGAEVGISTLKIHARGPVGLEGLMTYKWKLYGSGQTAADYADGRRSFTHRNLPLEQIVGT